MTRTGTWAVLVALLWALARSVRPAVGVRDAEAKDSHGVHMSVESATQVETAAQASEESDDGGMEPSYDAFDVAHDMEALAETKAETKAKRAELLEHKSNKSKSPNATLDDSDEIENDVEQEEDEIEFDATIEEGNMLNPEQFNSEYTGDLDTAVDPDSEKSREWIGKLSPLEEEELEERLGPEIYDKECSDYIHDTLALKNEIEDDWWLETLTKEPLVAGYMDAKTAEERDKEYEEAQKQSRGAIAQIFHSIWSAIKGAWSSVTDFFRGKWHGSAIARFREKIDNIKMKKEDKNGMKATVCSLDTSTLKLLPNSRHFHRALHEKALEQDAKNPKCAVDNGKVADPWSKTLDARKLVGAMDVDRVMRGTQMGIFRLCHFKCVRFIADNFEKMILTEDTKEGTFCKLSYSKQQAHIMGKGIAKGGPEKFLKQLIDSTETSDYDQCEILFAEKDTAPELIDYAVELACHPFARPTPYYLPSENPPQDLYNTKSPDNEPVCVPDDTDYEAHSNKEKKRNCPEGNVCHCQRNPVTKKTGAMSKIFDPRHWGEVEHCTAKRPEGAKVLIWVDATKMYLSGWQKNMEDLRRMRGGTKVGIALIMGGALYYSIFLLTMVKWSAIGAFFSGGAAGAGGAGLGGGFATAGAAIATVVTGPFGPGIIIGILALSCIIWSASFSCSANMGCYPTKCIYDKTMHQCRLKLPKDADLRSLAGNPLWYLPPPALACAYRGGFRATFGIKAESQCRLKPCPTERQAKGLVGYYRGYKDVQSFGNCQPLNVKDMNGAQQLKLFTTLNADKSVQRLVQSQDMGATLKVPDCISDANCAFGTRHIMRQANPVCRKYRCIRPLLTSMEVQVSPAPKDDNDESWHEGLKASVSKLVWSTAGKVDDVGIIAHDKVEDAEPSGGNSSGVLLERSTRSAIELIGIMANPAEGTLLEITDDWRSHVNGSYQKGGPNSSALLQRDTLRSLLRSSNGAGSEITVSTSFLNGVGCEPPACQTKKIQLAVITEKFEDAMDKLRSTVADEKTLEDPSRKASGLSFKIDQVGRNCESRTLPEHASKACDQAPSGGSCSLTCSDGWVEDNTIKCDDGMWTDEKPHNEESPGPDPVFACVDVACPIPRAVPQCPRSVPGCWLWEDSACERGGLSGSQNTCTIKPADGYRLVDPNVHSIKCLTSGQWEWAPKDKQPELEEEECDVQEAQQMYDKETVERICPSAYSGKSSQDGDAGYCALRCKKGFIDDPVAAGERLKCTLTGWTGHAKCVPKPVVQPQGANHDEAEEDEDMDDMQFNTAGMKKSGSLRTLPSTAALAVVMAASSAVLV